MNKNQIAVQDYALVNSKYKLNPAEIKFVMLAISKIDSVNVTDFKEEYIIPIHEISTAFGTAQNHAQLKTFAKSLMSKPLEVKTPSGGWAIFNFFSKVEYIEGAFKVRIDGDLKPYLLELQKNFVQTDLKYIMHMTSQYAVRLYQLLKQHQKLGGREFVLAELQDILQIPKSYTKKYNDFKTKVLDIAMTQINEHTDLTVSYKVKKLGRKINELDFTIRTKPKEELQIIGLFEAEDSIVPIEIEAIRGLCGFRSTNYYEPFTDGSFKLFREDGTHIFFKSMKQFKFHADNGFTKL